MFTPRRLGWSIGPAGASALLLASLSLAGCTGKQVEPEPAGTAPADPGAVTPGSDEDTLLPPPEYESSLPDSVRGLLDRPFKGDFDEMAKRRMIRVGVTFNRTHYFVDKGVQRGASYEYGKLFEDELNKKLKTGNLKIHVVFVPLPHDMLLPSLVDGKVDMVVAQLTVTAERKKLVDFSKPTRTNVNEVVVTGPGAPAIATVDDLSGQEVFARRSSSYYESLLALGEKLRAAGRPPVEVQAAPEALEDDDLLEMVNAGLIKITVVDSYLAEFWKQVFVDLTVHDTVAVSTGGQLAVAIRKNSPKLASEVNELIADFGLGSAFGNMMEKRYLQSTKFVRNATSDAERRKLEAVVALFKKYSSEYDLDYLLMAAQGFQESGLDQGIQSPVGAIGVMQVMPATGKDLDVGDIRQVDSNIHAGVKYMRFMIEPPPFSWTPDLGTIMLPEGGSRCADPDIQRISSVRPSGCSCTAVIDRSAMWPQALM